MDRSTNLVQFLERAVTRGPERELLGTRTTPGPAYDWIRYGAFGQRVDDARAGLAQRGVGPGTKVGIISDNRLEWAIAHFAALGRGACWVPMYEAELVPTWAHILRDSGVEVLFISKPAIYETVIGLRDGLPALRALILLEGDGADSLAALEAVGRARPVDAAQPAPEDLAVLIYTSGTTGDAKGVELTHANLVSNHYARRAMFPDIGEGSRTLSILPWAHVYGMGELHTWVEIGGSIGLVGSVDTLLGDLALVRPTFMLAVPRVFTRVYNALWAKMDEAGGLTRALFVAALAAAKRERERQSEGRRPGFDALKLKVLDRLVFAKIRARFGGRLEGVMTGSAAMNRDISQFFFDVGVPLYDAYGMTETSPGITVNCPAAHRPGSVGRPLEHVRIEIDASAVEAGATDGEIVVYGPNVMRGYHGRPEATAAILTPTGGLRTGDRGRFDADGFLYITGRIKEQFKLENGKYVFPGALEEALELHPMVQAAYVSGDGRPFCVAVIVVDPAGADAWAHNHGVPGGERTFAREDLQRHLADELSAALAGRFGSYEIPKRFLFVDEPFTVANGLLTQTMKLKRRNLAARFQDRITKLY